MRLRVVLLTLVFACVHARADEDTRAARQHFTRGSTLYDLGKFREAAQEYEQAYAAKSDPALLFNIGQAYRRASDYAAAMNAYRAYLRNLPSAPNRGAVEEHLRWLQQQRDALPSAAAPPVVSPTPAAPALAATPPSSAERPPLYRKWWLWTAVGAVAVVGVAVGVAVAYSVPKDAPAPAGAFTVSF
jgi:tetratricopeptide (TPR) repeat protein